MDIWPVTFFLGGGGQLAGDFLYVIYLWYYLVLLFGPNEKTCVHIAKGVTNLIFILLQIKETVFLSYFIIIIFLSKMMTLNKHGVI